MPSAYLSNYKDSANGVSPVEELPGLPLQREGRTRASPPLSQRRLLPRFRVGLPIPHTYVGRFLPFQFFFFSRQVTPPCGGGGTHVEGRRRRPQDSAKRDEAALERRAARGSIRSLREGHLGSRRASAGEIPARRESRCCSPARALSRSLAGLEELARRTPVSAPARPACRPPPSHLPTLHC